MIKYQTTKTLVTKPNNNSANAIAPNLIYGCFGGCVSTYCYMSRLASEMMFKSNQVKNKQGVMRYPLPMKSKAIELFKREYVKFFDINTIIYIF